MGELIEFRSRWVDEERKRISLRMGELIFPIVDWDEFMEYGAFPMVNAMGIYEPDLVAEARFKKACGILGRVAFPLSCFGVTNNLLAHDKKIKVEEAALMLMTLVESFGIVQGYLIGFAKKRSAARIAAEARAKEFDKKKERVRELFFSMDGLSTMSADAAAAEMIGKVDLSHRTIADVIREARKVQSATQTAHNT